MRKRRASARRRFLTIRTATGNLHLLPVRVAGAQSKEGKEIFRVNEGDIEVKGVAYGLEPFIGEFFVSRFM